MATFAYKISDFENKAESFINYLYSDMGKKRLNALGCKLIKSEIIDGAIEKTYRGSTTTIKISIASSKDDFYSNKTNYQFFIAENSDYIENFEAEIYEVPVADTLRTMAYPR